MSDSFSYCIMIDHSKAKSRLGDCMQAELNESSGKLQEAEQALQSMHSSSTAQQVQLSRQLTCQTEQLAAAHQVSMLGCPDPTPSGVGLLSIAVALVEWRLCSWIPNEAWSDSLF